MYKSLTYYPDKKVLIHIGHTKTSLINDVYIVKKEFNYYHEVEEFKKIYRGHFYIEEFLKVLLSKGYVEKKDIKLHVIFEIDGSE